MNQNSNSAKIYTGSSGGELKISLNNTKQIISATNNKAKYYADLAEEYKNEAKESYHEVHPVLKNGDNLIDRNWDVKDTEKLIDEFLFNSSSKPSKY